jgi:drug/metabolite transporter (DMT)-like permease
MPSPEQPPRKSAVSSAVLGVGCCILAAISYTIANACLKQLSTMREIDPAWATCIRESSAFVFACLCILVQIMRKKSFFPPWKEIGILVAVGLAVQMIGNLGILWAMGKVGLAVTIPTSSGMQLLACALGGRFLFGERLTVRSCVALGLLAIALIFLGMGAETAGKSNAIGQSASSIILFAVVASCLAGISYASLSIAMRRISNMAIPQTSLLFLVAGMGVATMWPLSFYRMGAAAMLDTVSTPAFLWLIAASAFNLIGFFGFAKGLQLTSVVHASVLNASQVAMSAIVGILYFNEPRNLWLALGIIVTVFGITLIDRPSVSETAEAMI